MNEQQNEDVFDNKKRKEVVKMSEQKTIELSPDGKSSIEIVDEHHMIIKSKKVMLGGQVTLQDQQS